MIVFIDNSALHRWAGNRDFWITQKLKSDACCWGSSSNTQVVKWCKIRLGFHANSWCVRTLARVRAFVRSCERALTNWLPAYENLLFSSVCSRFVKGSRFYFTDRLIRRNSLTLDIQKWRISAVAFFV
jgi:hypothetical protein